jgi:hypothetical protein
MIVKVTAINYTVNFAFRAFPIACKFTRTFHSKFQQKDRKAKQLISWHLARVAKPCSCLADVALEPFEIS